jgi:glutathione S-transferase
MKLYYSPGACSLAAHILLRETDADFQLVKVDTNTHKTSDGEDFYRINPKGQVPFLDLGTGDFLSEGTVIAQYITDQTGQQELMPKAGTRARYKVMEWQNYITTELHKTFTPLFNSQLDAAAKAVFHQQLQKKFSWVNEQLANKKFLTGDLFTAADAYLFVVTGWAKYVQLDLSHLEHLNRFLAAVSARPAVKKAMQVEGLIAA